MQVQRQCGDDRRLDYRQGPGVQDHWQSEVRPQFGFR
jgi:hypothetical protein